MNPFVRFMASTTGRLVRIAAGLGLGAWGVWRLHGAAGTAVAVIGLIPLFAGLFDICLFAPLFSCPIRGARIRGAASR